jgi:hypothetical protein
VSIASQIIDLSILIMDESENLEQTSTISTKIIQLASTIVTESSDSIATTNAADIIQLATDLLLVTNEAMELIAIAEVEKIAEAEKAALEAEEEEGDDPEAEDAEDAEEED